MAASRLSVIYASHEMLPAVPVEVQSPKNLRNCLLCLPKSNRDIFPGLVYQELFLQRLPASARTSLHSVPLAMRSSMCARRQGKSDLTLLTRTFAVLSDCSSHFV